MDEIEAGHRARWKAARARAKAEPVGACHASGGAFHRCDGPATWCSVRIGGGRWEPYRWCKGARAEAFANAVREGKPLTLRPGLIEAVHAEP